MQRSRELDAAVAVLGVSWLVMFFGGAYGWWVDWWHSTSDFRLPILLVAVASSALAGIVAAASYDWIRKRSERRRWRVAEFVGATQLTGSALAVAEDVAFIIRQHGSPAPAHAASADGIRAVEAAFKDGQFWSNHQIAEKLGAFSTQAWEIVSTMPGLREDPDLMTLTAQAAGVVPHWTPLLEAVDSRGVPESEAENVHYVVLKCATTAWQLVRFAYEFGNKHIDPELGQRVDAEYQRDTSRIRAMLSGSREDQNSDPGEQH